MTSFEMATLFAQGGNCASANIEFVFFLFSSVLHKHLTHIVTSCRQNENLKKKSTFDTNMIQGTGGFFSCVHIVMWNAVMLAFVFEAAHYFQGNVESNNLIR